MSWLTPIGFLGLIGLIVLLIIYLIKPNFQQKFISSTFVWKLSLKYKKKKLPLSKLRNILIIICQILIVTILAIILAQPFVSGDDENADKEKIIIIDASASMLSAVADETRFERAVTKAAELAAETFDNGGTVSVIVAGKEASVLVRRQNEDNADAVDLEIRALADEGNMQCTYGNADIDGAIALSETILEENPKAEIILYTGVKYIDDGKITVKTEEVVDEGEVNVSILDVRAVRDEGYYRFEVDVASYARPMSVKINIEIHGATGSYGSEKDGEKYNNETVKLSYGAALEANKRTTVTFGQNEQDNLTDLKISEYDHVYCYIQVKDSLSIDNTFYLYGGKPQPLRIQYYSTQANIFVESAIKGLRDILRDDWKIEFVPCYTTDTEIKQGIGKEPALEGFDIYIFEHNMPKQFPTDGLVIVIDPDKLPKNSDFVLGNNMAGNQPWPLEAVTTHPLLDYMTPSNIKLSEWIRINTFDSSYTPLLSIDGIPVVIAKNEPNSKMLVFAFNFHYSDFVLTPEFLILMNNVVNYYMPKTFEKDVIEIYDTVTLNSRSEKLSVVGPGNLNETFTEFPATVTADAPGLYTVTQTPISGQQIVENFFVTIPAEQCNIVREVDTLTNPYYPPVDDESLIDFVFYFALAVVAILFLEWWLKSRENN